MVSLPSEYESRLRGQLGDEFEDYLKSFDRPVWQGFRINSAKLSAADYLARRGVTAAEPVPWCPDGFIADGEPKEWSKHPDYFAGLYYLQEPSAMAPAAYLPIEPGDRVLDLCAAPGGKSTQLAARLNGSGLLVSNDISPSRAKALLKNLELFGTANAAVISEAPFKLAARFEGFFDKILVDAPCSGEGMFHKEPAIMKNWAQYGSGYYRDLQREILPDAVKMLAPGGMLLYSTCTFAPCEDEEIVEWLLESYPELSVVPLNKAPGIDDGHPEWSLHHTEAVKGCARFWPHRIKGQGHFVALLKKADDASEADNRDADFAFVNRPVVPKVWTEWEKENLVSPEKWDENRLRLLGEKLYMNALPMEKLDGLRVLRNGLFLGEVAFDRFEPAEAFAMALRRGDAKRELNLPLDDRRVIRYLKGETLNLADGEEVGNGWTLVLADGYSLGWAKVAGTVVKNKYLKAWKMN